VRDERADHAGDGTDQQATQGIPAGVRREVADQREVLGGLSLDVDRGRDDGCLDVEGAHHPLPDAGCGRAEDDRRYDRDAFGQGLSLGDAAAH